jgi:hypothetical protein
MIFKRLLLLRYIIRDVLSRVERLQTGPPERRLSPLRPDGMRLVL